MNLPCSGVLHPGSMNLPAARDIALSVRIVLKYDGVSLKDTAPLERTTLLKQRVLHPGS